MHVVNAMAVKHLNQDLERGLANVGSLHRRDRHADVVNGDGYAHAWLELGKQRITTVRVIERVANRSLTIHQPLNRRVWINDARAHRQILKNEIHTRGEYARGAIAIDVDD